MSNKTGFCVGVWDTFHYGHLQLIKRAANLVDYLVVAVVEDAAVTAQKGQGRPVFPFEHRLAIITGLKYPKMIVGTKSFDAYDTFAGVSDICGKIDVFIKGEDQAHIPVERIVKDFGVEIVTLLRTPDISTTDIVKRLGGANVSYK